ncbi:MAG: helix-turn-helix domain-containing protein, partial [Candidatus Pacearchaeota archaeon]|nr:helix-turn-helix domain-containing protein [Candidatus Pacearchaeota archaeon]
MTDELIIKAFESVGIPKTQTTVYLDLLKNKESTATQISKRTKMHRANVYDTLTKLKERNLVYLSSKEGKQVFAALSTDLIVNEEKDKLEELKLAMNYIKTAYVSNQTLKVYTLEGLNAVKSILFGLLDKKSDVWIYGLAENENIINVLNDKLMHSFHLERIKNHVELKLLFYKTPHEEIKTLSNLKFTEAKLLPKTQQSKTSQITQIVCHNSVYVTLWIDPIYTIVIENDIIAKEYL